MHTAVSTIGKNNQSLRIRSLYCFIHLIHFVLSYCFILSLLSFSLFKPDVLVGNLSRWRLKLGLRLGSGSLSLQLRRMAGEDMLICVTFGNSRTVCGTNDLSDPRLGPRLAIQRSPCGGQPRSKVCQWSKPRNFVKSTMGPLAVRQKQKVITEYDGLDASKRILVTSEALMHF